jgi:hypothetical protein
VFSKCAHVFGTQFVDLSHHLLSPLLVENDWESVEQRLQSAYWMEPIDDLVDIDIGEAVRTVDAKVGCASCSLD